MTLRNGPRITSRSGETTNTHWESTGCTKCRGIGGIRVSIALFLIFVIQYSLMYFCIIDIVTISDFHIFFNAVATQKLNKDWLRRAQGCGLASALLTISKEERDTPTILEYKVTYGGRI